jgi:hypothetical protein
VHEVGTRATVEDVLEEPDGGSSTSSSKDASGSGCSS